MIYMSFQNQQQEMTIYEKGKGGSYRWVTITTLLLSIGAILHLITPSIGGITPDWTIAMYCIAINLTKPTIGQSFGIGLAAAAITIPTSKSAFPYGNLLSEPIGAVVCALLVHLSANFLIGKFNIKPAVSGFLGTVSSGITFITTLKLVLALPMSVYLYAMMPIVFTVATINAIITQLLYFPAKRLLDANRGKNASDTNK
jgi:energy-coupling factor transport system ATP-binding protein